MSPDPQRFSAPPEETWRLRLYVAGQSPKSLRAFANLTTLCEEHLAGRYEIEIIDLVEHPELARSDDILAIPTLVRRLPAPLRKIMRGFHVGRLIRRLLWTSEGRHPGHRRGDIRASV